jgi:peptidoglycan/LPS O-acetylase OafA/YrhL
LSDTLPGDNDQPLRFIVSTLTFGLIVISNLESTTKGCLSSRFGVWLGDISYGLYLAHWPLLIAHQHILYSIYKPYLSISGLIFFYCIELADNSLMKTFSWHSFDSVIFACCIRT